MNSEQRQGLLDLRNKFVADREKIASMEEGTVHTKLDVLTLDELRFLAQFPQTSRSAIVDLNVDDSQLADDLSPVRDLARAARDASKAALVLEADFTNVGKAFRDEMNSGFRLESVAGDRNVNYLQIFKDVGLVKERVTLKMLRDFDVKAEAQKIKDIILERFGFEELAKMHEPGGPALKLDRLIETGFEGMKDGPNPVLFEALAAQVVDDLTEREYGLTGYVKGGNVRLKIARPNDTGKMQVDKGIMFIVEVGLRPSAFTLEPTSEEYFPNTPQMRHKAISVKPAQELETIVRDFSDPKNGNLKFKVAATIHRKIGVFAEQFGFVIHKPAASGAVKMKLKS